MRVLFSRTTAGFVLAVAVCLAVSSTVFAQQKPTFGQPTISGIRGVGFEEDIRLDPMRSNRVYLSVPGSLSLDTAWIWHSEDGGKTFKWVTAATAKEGKPDPLCPGGGDTEPAVDTGGNLYFIDLMLVNFSTARSEDNGKSFTVVPVPCNNVGVPDAVVEDLSRQFEQVAKAAAPFVEVAPGAQEAARAQRAGMGKQALTWTQVGAAPLFANDPAEGDPIDGVNFLGWIKLSARPTSFASDPSTPGRLFVSVAGGGVWQSLDGGNRWRSVGDNLPTQVVGAIAFTPYGGGKVVAGTGDPAMAGGLSLSGLGVYTSTDLRLWSQASGVPSGTLTFRIALDPSDATGATLYAATSKGLFRSTDGGSSFVNVALPTTPSGYSINCAGDTTKPECFFANIVTDVVVRPPDPNGQGGGKVMAAVGWYGGQLHLRQADGTLSTTLVQSPQNGIYVSSNGRPGTFVFVNPGSGPTGNGFAVTPVVGRTALSVARGAGQNHDIVYAIVQDAQKIAGCLNDAQAGLNLGTCLTGTVTAPPTVLDGAYVSTNFGSTWTKIMDWLQLQLPGTNSALAPFGDALGYGPGVQAWYNLWIEADPTATDSRTKAPTRVLFGLEEVWENGVFGLPQIGPSAAAVPWRVIGRYWNACDFSIPDAQCNSASYPPITTGTTTTHPDQHAALFLPDGTGGVTLFAGNDGGAYQQHVAAGQDFSNDGWGAGANDGLATLLPYHVAVAKDGTVTAGLQDNGEIKITPTGYEEMIFGGDGFFTAVDPNNSKNIVEEYAGGVVSITTDGGKTWAHVNPGLTSPLFATPLAQDPGTAGHVMIGGREVMEVNDAYVQANTCIRGNTPVQEICQNFTWTKVFDLGTADHPGTGTSSSTADPNNRLSAVDVRGDAAYVGYCGPCSGTGQHRFGRGIATNVGGALPPKRLTPNGWHVIADPSGLPKRYITSIHMDPANPLTLYVTLGGYSTHWVPPGAIFDESVGAGHVFKSTDGGNSFVDISGNLPDTPADWVEIHGSTVVVGTDIGVFISGSLDGGTYQVLGDLPSVPTVAMTFAPGNPDLLYAATYGRGIWSLLFGGGGSGGGCHTDDGDGDEHGRNGGTANFKFHHDDCNQQPDSEDFSDPGSGTDFHGTQVTSVARDNVAHSVTIAGLGTNNGLPVVFTIVAVDSSLVPPGLFSITLSDGYTNSGNLLDGSIVLH